jgi:hypothetical protein
MLRNILCRLRNRHGLGHMADVASGAPTSHHPKRVTDRPRVDGSAVARGGGTRHAEPRVDTLDRRLELLEP